jgi:hypothetical protein
MRARLADYEIDTSNEGGGASIVCLTESSPPADAAMSPIFHDLILSAAILSVLSSPSPRKINQWLRMICVYYGLVEISCNGQRLDENPGARRERFRLLRNLRLKKVTYESGGGKMPKRSSSGTKKYGRAASKNVKSAMRRKKKGTLKSGKGGKGGTVKSRKQAIAIGLSEARKKGAKVPPKKRK